MEIYTLDDLFRRQNPVIDQFESMIWTERFAEYGDFELKIDSTRESRALFKLGTRLAINESHRVMTVDSIEDDTDEEGQSSLLVKGKSLEYILEDRVVKKTLSNLTTEPQWVLEGTPLQVVRWMFDTVVRQGDLSPYDKIPLLMPGTMMPVDTIPPSDQLIRWEQPVASLYSAIKAVCDLYDMGFRLYRHYDTSQLYFDIYTGSDRTTQQDILPSVIFSPNLDNLKNTKEYTTAEEAKNCAYVISEQGFEIVYPLNVDPEIDGFERRVLLVEANNLEGDPTPEEISAYLTQAGLDELTKHRVWFGFDGEHSQHSEYKYGTHYNLGDLVEMHSADGVANTMRVTEQIFVCDGEGERSYPTLAVNQYINPGSWLAWDYNQVWADLGNETWADQP